MKTYSHQLFHFIPFLLIICLFKIENLFVNLVGLYRFQVLPRNATLERYQTFNHLDEGSARYERESQEDEDELPFELEVSKKIVSHYNGTISVDTPPGSDITASYTIKIPMMLPNEADGSVYGQSLFDAKSKTDPMGNLERHSQLENTQVRDNLSSHLTPSHHKKNRSRDVSTYRDQLLNDDTPPSERTIENDLEQQKRSTFNIEKFNRTRQ